MCSSFITFLILTLRPLTPRKYQVAKALKVIASLHSPKMTDQSGVRKLILLPLIRYQQLLQALSKMSSQHPTAKTAVAQQQTSPCKENKDTESASRKIPENEGECSEKVSLPRTDSFSESLELFKTLKSRFPKDVRNDAKRLYNYLTKYGRDILSITQTGDVYVRDRILDSNIFDFLYATVDSSARKPAGFSVFLRALTEIGVPRDWIKRETDKQKRSGLVKSHSRNVRWEPY